MKESAYVGKISNAGTQFIPGPNVKNPEKKDKIKTGTDLRYGKGK